MRKSWRTFIWLSLAFLALGLYAFNVSRGQALDFRQALHHLKWEWAIWAVILQLMAQTLLASRWIILLRVQGVELGLYQAIKLTYLGLFYNNMMPGAVGGDLLKGWYVTQHSPPNLRVEAAVTVFVDRLAGLIGIVLVGACASLFIGPELNYRGFQIRWVGWLIFAAMVVVSVIFLSRRVRRVLQISRLMDKLPFANLLRQVDSAIRIYRHHHGTILLALLLTAVIQGASIVAIWFLTKMLNLHLVTLLQCLSIMPIIWVISAAIPVPGGLGVVENLVTYLYCKAINPNDPDAAMGQAAALALTIRMLICLCSLPGALVPIFGGHLPKTAEIAREMEKETLEEQQELPPV